MTKCVNCIFYDSENSKVVGQGSCRRKPPRATTFPTATPGGMQLVNITLWPEVKETDGCGKGQPKNVS